MDALLGLPWFCRVQPAIDWQTYHVLWEHKGDVVFVYGWSMPPTDVINTALGALCSMMEVVSTKHFYHNLQCSDIVNTAWVGLLCEAEWTCASAVGVDGDVAGATCLQCTALAMLLQEFHNVFHTSTCCTY